MITLRQIERLWAAGDYVRISCIFMEMRAESSAELIAEFSHQIPAAAMAVIRLDELSQSHVPFCGRMIREIFSSQEADGGWGDAMTTALCLRALMCSGGDGVAIDRGLQYLVNLQRSDGLWPKVPLRRMPGDAYVSAVVLYELAAEPRSGRAIRVGDALAWLDVHQGELDAATTRLWRIISRRHGATARQERSAVGVWS